jgi:hypothetical protein
MPSSRPFVALVFGSLAVAAVGSGACSATPSRNAFSGTAASASGGSGSQGSAHGGNATTGNAQGGSTGVLMVNTGGSTGTGSGGDPTTCAEAAANKTYLGCDFWPTVTANNVWSIFDFAAVVANAGAQTAMVTVTGNGQNQTVMVAPNSLETLYLPWVAELKGQDTDACVALMPLGQSREVPGGAYHLVSSVPVTVYQFSALEYKGQGGPPGKDWSTCPGNQNCVLASPPSPSGCYSFTNDASLLLPSTAMTGNYRVTGITGWLGEVAGATLTITGTQANTNVKVFVAPSGHFLEGGTGSQIVDTPGGGVMSFTLGAGDVVELAGYPSADNTGSLVQADKPVQVISGHPCTYIPQDINYPACDHIEQSVFPAETLGKHYFVAPPTAPHADPTKLGHVVRIVGNVDGTHITYPSGFQPAGAPTTLNAGQVADLGILSQAFEIKGDHEFAVATFMLGASLSDPNDTPPNQLGDPSQSNAIAVEQYRVKYVFLAPTDYTESYVDITEPMNAKVMLDGAPVTAPITPIGSSSFGIARVLLGPGQNGAHVLTSAAPVGIQVIGYGSYTSYQYPGGLNLTVIAPPPPTPK